jgi:hypothetical protein
MCQSYIVTILFDGGAERTVRLRLTTLVSSGSSEVNPRPLYSSRFLQKHRRENTACNERDFVCNNLSKKIFFRDESGQLVWCRPMRTCTSAGTRARKY